ncbi:hypothetical protein I2I11_11270 [Pontibacter sp. 172403-2]|uniref:hypothetical protein n=1 Tax=Pontibacter rufus TaxID=2791028 RepID=UPI0018AF8583|nr:hypothetical protein [Pontibacter sp. 172403-2]MBF9253873.1 hypothetical protein [Pontibacter sp. 172403-2]
MKLLNKFIFVLATVFVLTFQTTDAYSQCAMCQATVESNAGKGHEESDNQVGTGLNTGILYLMVAPYVLIGIVGFLWYRSNHKKKA